MIAIFKRELRAYFTSPIGYIFLAVFYIFGGFFFFSGTLMADYADLSGVFIGLFTIVLFLIPILTMRLFSEDLRQRTDQALLTAPVRLSALVLGKFFSAATVYLLALLITPVYGIIVNVVSYASWSIFLGNFAAIFLLGLAMISIGMFISSMTENQVIAAVGGFAVALFLLLIDVLSMVFTGPVISKVILALNFYSRYNSFSYGMFDLTDVFFFLSVCFVFLFLTVRVFDKRRWA